MGYEFHIFQLVNLGPKESDMWARLKRYLMRQDTIDTMIGMVARRSCCITRLEDENKHLRSAIEGALKISSLWEPPDDGTLVGDHDGEYEALCRMKDQFENALSETEGGDSDGLSR